MDTRQRAQFAGPGIMFLSVLLFGWFGFGFQLGLPFGINWNTPGVDGNPVLFRVLLGWTLQISSIAFLVSALVTFAAPMAGNAIYAVVGLVSAALLVVVAIMDIIDQQHGIMPYGPFVLFIFAAFNGWGSLQGIRAVLDAQRARKGSAA